MPGVQWRPGRGKAWALMCLGVVVGTLCTRATLLALHTETQVVTLAKELVQQEQQVPPPLPAAAARPGSRTDTLRQQLTAVSSSTAAPDSHGQGRSAQRASDSKPCPPGGNTGAPSAAGGSRQLWKDAPS